MFKQLLDQLTTNATAPTAQTNNPGLLGSPAMKGVLGGVGGGLLAGLLMSNKKVRKVASYGGAAALGALAITAYRNYQSHKNPTSAPVGTAAPAATPALLNFDQKTPTEQENESRVMLAAMVAAAKADGQFDDAERQLIRERVRQLGDSDAVAWAQAEIQKPLNVNDIAAMATNPELASEIYLASLIIIDEQNEREQNYLNQLGDCLNLPPQLRAEIAKQIRPEPTNADELRF
jgi:uncharacterized membrane protein YebE (DUF533 family)